MKVGILTFHWGVNYGAILQAYALSKYLSDCGADVKLIDYYPKRYKKNIINACITRHINLIPSRIKEIRKAKRVESFKLKNLSRTKYYSSNKELKKEKFDFDCYITGSDQVWNESFLESGERKRTYSYFLDFVPDDKIIASYAASFGVTDYKKNLKEDIKKYLERFDLISVRERTGIDILNSMGIDNVCIVPDPTLLLHKANYESLLGTKPCNDKYAFVYMLHGKLDDANACIEDVRSRGIKDYISSDSGVEDWLAGIYYAQTIITNSFHGVVFSILFEKPFIAILIEGSGMNDRIITLLEKLGLQDRIYCGTDIIDKPIDWDSVSERLNEFRAVGYEYINKIFNYKNLDYKIIEKNACSGCHACYSSCPVRCITMEYDEEGFLYPHIDKEKCVNCGQCKNVCPVLKDYSGNIKGRAYACINKDEDIRMQSSSGGIFTLLAEKVIDSGGIVYGAAFDEEFNVHHIEISEKSELYKLRGSKYVQSRIGDTYKQVKEQLKNKKNVLFSGTPCQISGLKSFLNKDYENLIMLDIVCHGVPSPRVWQKYVKYREKEAASKTKKAFFRYKKHGWKMFSVLFEFTNGTEYEQIFSKDLFMQGFLVNLDLRPSCYNCHSKSLERESDITLADFWGVERVLPEMFDDKGTSLVFVNSEKGKNLFEKISDKMFYKAVDIDETVKYNSAAYKSCDITPKRDAYMASVDSTDFKTNTERFTKQSILRRIKSKIKRIIKRVIKRI